VLVRTSVLIYQLPHPIPPGLAVHKIMHKMFAAKKSEKLMMLNSDGVRTIDMHCCEITSPGSKFSSLDTRQAHAKLSSSIG